MRIKPRSPARTILARGRYRAFEAQGAEDLRAALRLRADAFPADREGGDGHDAACRHVLIEEVATSRAVGTFRALPLVDGSRIQASYSARHYGLDALGASRAPMMEVGRFCIAPRGRDPDILRLAWGAITCMVERHGVEMLFGCASFRGTDAGVYGEAFALLEARHLAPARWRPRVKAPRVVSLARAAGRAVDLRRAMEKMPPLLRTYLAMGGRVSDHAVVDEEMDTLHVFTGVEVGAIPPARQRLLRAVAG